MQALMSEESSALCVGERAPELRVHEQIDSVRCRSRYRHPSVLIGDNDDQLGTNRKSGCDLRSVDQVREFAFDLTLDVQIHGVSFCGMFVGKKG